MMSDENKARLIGKRPESTGGRTRIVAPGPFQVPTQAPDPGNRSEIQGGDDTRTRIYRPPTSNASVHKPKGESTRSDWDPVVGWVVVVQGAGRGRSFEIRSGLNGIGRGSSNKIILDFGDESISPEAQAFVTFDAKSSKFYVSHGDGRELCYLNDKPVLQPLELQGGETLLLGETVLKFVRFCDDSFAWDHPECALNTE